MFVDNPIILKELVQAAHRPRTYLVRAGLPALAMLLVAVQMPSVLRRYGNDWRAVAQVSRPIFETCAWLELVTFSLLAFVYAAGTIQEEWTRKTMEVLCATPLSARRILYGKFAIVLVKVLAAGLALLPVMGVWFHLGRIPREMALGSFAVIAGSTLLFGSMGLVQAAAFRPGVARGAGLISAIVPYFFIVTLLDAYVWVGHPLLEASIPPRALYLVLTGTPPGGLSIGWFALLSLAILSGVSALALGVAPCLFGRTFARQYGPADKAGRLRRLRRALAGRRPRMGPNEDPFLWQEKGPPTSLLRHILWIVYGIMAAFMAMHGFVSGDFGFMRGDALYVMFAGVGLAVLASAALVYGCGVFAREKSHRRAEALVLTGVGGWRMYRAKIAATYWGLRYSIAAVTLACVGMSIARRWIRLGPVFAIVLFGLVLFIAPRARMRVPAICRCGVWGAAIASVLLWLCTGNTEAILASMAMVQALALGPGIGVSIGMAFGLSARSPARAALGLAGTVIWMLILGWILVLFVEVLRVWRGGPGPWLFVTLTAIAVLFRGTRRWAPWRLGLMLALCVWAGVLGVATAHEFVEDVLAWWGDRRDLATAVAGNLIVLALVGLWLVLGLRIFDRGMTGEGSAEVRARRRG